MIEIIERATIETKGFNQNFGNNEDLQKRYEEDGTVLPDKNDAEIGRGKDDLTKYPVVWIDGVQIESTNIKSLKLFNNSFMPTLRLEFTDPSQKLIDENFPVDNSVISIFKNSNIKDLMGMKMDFKITDFTVVYDTGKKKKGKSYTYAIDAIMDVDDFYLMNFESYKGTSYDIIKKLMLEMKLGFATNTTNSNDEMVWINNANYRIEFIRNIIDKTYINDNTFLFGYIDFYYNFNYIDVEKQIKEDISSQMNLMENEKVSKDVQNSEVPLILSNNPDQENTNMFIQKYTLINSSTNINLQYGYRHRVTFYNKIDDEIKRYAIDTISDDQDNAIVLKGNYEDNNKLYNDMYNGTWMGKMDTDNVHENFLHSQSQNKNNLKFLQKLKMTVRLSKINYGLYRFQKVLVELYDMGRLDKTEKSAYTETELQEGGVSQHDDKIIHKLSGEWIITAINITFSRENGNVQELTLVKRELTKEYTFPRRARGNNTKKKKKDESQQKSSDDKSNIVYDSNPFGSKNNISLSKDDLLSSIKKI